MKKKKTTAKSKQAFDRAFHPAFWSAAALIVAEYRVLVRHWR